MDSKEREAVISARKSEILGDFDAHLQTVEDLAVKYNLDLDVMTEITPNLLDGTKPGGRDTLAFYQKLYQAVESKERYIVISRYSTGLAPGCYGFGQDAKYEINEVWLRTFKNLTPDKIRYIKGDGVGSYSRVQIDGPSTLSTIGKFIELSSNEPVTLLSAEPHKTGSWREVTPELFNGLPAIESGDRIHSIISAVHDNIYEPSYRMGKTPNFNVHTKEFRKWYTKNLHEDYPKVENSLV